MVAILITKDITRWKRNSHFMFTTDIINMNMNHMTSKYIVKNTVKLKSKLNGNRREPVHLYHLSVH